MQFVQLHSSVQSAQAKWPQSQEQSTQWTGSITYRSKKVRGREGRGQSINATPSSRMLDQRAGKESGCDTQLA